MNDFDVIVVGGGLGGLTAGAKLAREGCRVLLLEQHAVVGGCATVFRRRDFRVEVGLHEMDGLDQGDPKTRILNDLGVLEQVEMVRAPEFFRFVNSRLDFVMPDNADEAIRALEAVFPREKRGIRKYFKTIAAIRREAARLPDARWKINLTYPLMPALYPRLVYNMGRDLGRFLDAVIEDEDLKLLLQANLVYYHDDPYSMSMIYFGAAQASYFTGGGHYIKGGSQQLSDYLAGQIKAAGGTVLCRRLVTSILVRHGRAVGVAYRRTRGQEREIHEAFAPAVVANSAVPNVVNLLPQDQGARLKRRISPLQPACSLLSIYLGFEKDPACAGSRHYSTFVFDGGLTTQRRVLDNHHGDPARRNFVFADYSRIDSGLAPDGKGMGAICAPDYLEDWVGLDPDAYARKKEAVAKVFVKRLDDLHPGIRDLISYCEVGTPKTVRRYTLNPHGTAYGYAQTPRQAGLRRMAVRSGVPDLYFASAWAFPGGGFTGAIWGGWLCAGEVLRGFSRRPWRWKRRKSRPEKNDKD
ncbi:MAG: NAD(P)/FAD-dependent oxidoreductase [Desulfosarcinaceae bacterium]